LLTYGVTLGALVLAL